MGAFQGFKAKLAVFLGAISTLGVLLPTLISAQGGIKPGFQPGQFQPKIAPKLTFDPSKLIVDPFANLQAPVYPDRLKLKRPITPGNEVELPIPDSMELGQATILVESVATSELWEVPVVSLHRIMKVPSIYAPRQVRAPVMQGKTGFIAPQLPKGAYRVFFSQSTTQGPKTTFQIEPKLRVSASRAKGRLLDSPFSLSVSLVGPSFAPTVLRSKSKGSRLPNGETIAVGALLNVHIPPTIVRLNVTTPNSGNLSISSSNPVRMDESGRARFEFVGHQAGLTTVLFTAPGVNDLQTSIRISAKPIETVVEQPNRPLRLVVLGDSVVWGQGLKEEHKYSKLVEQFMEAETSRTTNRSVYAHSGGTAVSAMDDSDPNRKIPQEIPVWYPTTERQLEYALDDLDGKTVDLVLMNGGANDIPLNDVLNPFTNSKEKIKNVAEGLEDPIKDLIVKTARTFECRKSLIVYTGYYPVITSHSDIELMASALFVFFSLIPSLEVKVAGLLGTLALEALLIAEHPTLNEQSSIFYDTLTQSLKNAVNRANSELGTDAGTRVIFVDPGFTTKNAFACPDTLIWTYGVEDEVADKRLTQGAPFALEAPVYPVASLGHPNVEGAQAYADKIKTAIRAAGPRLIWDGTKPRRQMQATSTVSAFTIPSRKVEEEFSFRISARDASTGAALKGDIYIGGEFQGKTGELIKRSFRRPTALSPRPSIVVVRPGYVDAEFSYQIR